MEDNMKEFVAFSRKLLRVLIELRELLEEGEYEKGRLCGGQKCGFRRHKGRSGIHHRRYGHHLRRVHPPGADQGHERTDVQASGLYHRILYGGIFDLRHDHRTFMLYLLPSERKNRKSGFPDAAGHAGRLPEPGEEASAPQGPGNDHFGGSSGPVLYDGRTAEDGADGG